RDPRNAQRVSLLDLGVDDRTERRDLHADRAGRPRPALRLRLARNVDHSRGTRGVDVGKLVAHRTRGPRSRIRAAVSSCGFTLPVASSLVRSTIAMACAAPRARVSSPVADAAWARSWRSDVKASSVSLNLPRAPLAPWLSATRARRPRSV